MIKKLLLTLSFIVLATIAFSGMTYAAQAGETIVITEELSNLNKLYIEGVITEEEFSKAKSILLDSDSGTTKKKKKAVIFKKQKLTAVERKNLEKLEKEELKAAKAAKKAKKILKKKKKLTAVERRDLKEAEENKLIEEREQLLAEKKAFREASAEEKERLLEEKRQACLDDPKTKGCDWLRVKNVLKFWK